MEHEILKKNKKNQKLVNPIILLEPQKKEYGSQASIKITCVMILHAIVLQASMKLINIARFNSVTPKELIIFVDLIQKASVGQHVTTGSTLYRCMERVLKCGDKAKFSQQANLVGSRTVGNFAIVMATMTVHVFHVLAYQDQKRN